MTAASANAILTISAAGLDPAVPSGRGSATNALSTLADGFQKLLALAAKDGQETVAESRWQMRLAFRLPVAPPGDHYEHRIRISPAIGRTEAHSPPRQFSYRA